MKLLLFIILFLPQTNFAEELLISSRPVKLKAHSIVEDDCLDCHKHKDRAQFPRKDKPIKNHKEISNLHGKIQVSCHNCHDPVNSNHLKSSDLYKADFHNPSPVCSTCHAKVFEDWRRGLHGKRVSPGTDGVREQFHCVDCHDPHSVTFKKMQALPAPKKPKLLIEKHEETKEHSE